MKKIFQKKGEHGFTLLLSLLIASIVLSISLSVFGIIVREISLSTSARESRLAFYGANAGIECALYWDFVQDMFATNTPGGISNAIECNGVSFDVGGWDSCAPSACSSSNDDRNGRNIFQLPLDNGSCAFEVEVVKECIGALGGCGANEPDKKILTTIRSRGHNICTEGFVVERGLQVQY